MSTHLIRRLAAALSPALLVACSPAVAANAATARARAPGAATAAAGSITTSRRHRLVRRRRWRPPLPRPRRPTSRCSCTGAPSGVRPARRSRRRSSTSASSRSARACSCRSTSMATRRARRSTARHFGVVGYPTMILFRPDGTEITRLPGGVDVDALRDHPRRGARRRATGRRDPGGAAQGRDRVRRTTGACSPITHGSPTTSARSPEAERCRDVPPAERALPGRARGRLRATLLRVPLRRAAVTEAGGTPSSGLERAEARERLLSAAWQAVRAAGRTCRTCRTAPTTRSACCRTQGSPERGDLTPAWTKALDMLGQW